MKNKLLSLFYISPSLTLKITPVRVTLVLIVIMWTVTLILIKVSIAYCFILMIFNYTVVYNMQNDR